MRPEDQGADGMAFVCMGVGKDEELGVEGGARLMGEGGAGLGYDTLGGEGDWAVEIDTYQTYVRPPNSSPENPIRSSKSRYDGES